jgi:hypothetical protein
MEAIPKPRGEPPSLRSFILVLRGLQNERRMNIPSTRGNSMKLFILLCFLLPALNAKADCKTQLQQIIESAEPLILGSDLDPRCKALGLKGGKQNCIKATDGTIWELKALMEPVLTRARNHCKKGVCANQGQICSSLLSNETHLVKVGIYGLLNEIEDANW